MVYQSGRNIGVSWKLESNGFGKLAGPTGAKAFRPNSGSLLLSKEPSRPGENRRDLMTRRARHGSRAVAGSYVCDLSVGSVDELIEAVFRGVFTPVLTITEAMAGLTSITTSEHAIIAAAGSWITAGLRVGDVFRLAGHASAANNGINLRCIGLTASTITVAETLVANAVADAAFSVVRPKKLLQGVLARSFNFEEHEADIDGSEVFKGVRVTSLQVQLQPNGNCTLTFGLVGQDMEMMTGANAPYFTDPVEYVSIGLSAIEAMVRLGSVDMLDVTALDITLNLNGAGVPVVGSKVTPEVFTNVATVEGSITALKSDVTRGQQFLNETELSLHLMFVEPDSVANDFCSFFLGNFTLGSATKGEIGTDNGRTQSFSLLPGVDERGGAFDRTILKYQTSAA